MLKIEFKKVKLINLILVLLIIPLLANAFGIINYLGNKEMLTHQWQSLWTQVSLFYLAFFYIPLIAIIVASLWQIEHKAGLNFIRLSPKRNIHFVIGKFIIASLVITLAQIYFLGIFYLGGKFICHFQSTDFKIYIYYIIFSISLAMPIIAIFQALAIKINSFGIVVLLSAMLTMLGFAQAYKGLKIIGISYFAFEANNLRFINLQDSLFLLGFAIVEIVLFTILSIKFLKYENK